MSTSGKILWQPSPEVVQQSRLHAYKQWLKEQRGIETTDYESLWQWSVDHVEDFWESVAMYFKVHFHSPYTSILPDASMPGASWFPGATLNYAEQIFAGMRDQDTAIHFQNEKGATRIISVQQMTAEVAKLREWFLRQGVKRGDRICGFLPNIPEATFAFLAAASIGAVWSCCSQDFGVSSVVDRFFQIEPVLFIAADGYYYNGKTHSKASEIIAIQAALPTLKKTLLISYTGSEVNTEYDVVLYDAIPDEKRQLAFDLLPFDHPLWILYSSGTTGAPKAITHSHGGCLLEHLKYLAFHNDVHPGEKFFWYTTTGWMMWNFLQASMMMGATIVLYDGSPSYPNLNALWDMASATGMQHFGTSAPFLVACMKAHIHPGQDGKLNQLRSIGSTGSPLPPEAFDWVYDSIHRDIWLCSMSGGTDVCTAFVGGVIEKPVIEGEIQGRGLGCSLYAYDDLHNPVIDTVGEMVITKPMPAMPIYFWNDADHAKYKQSYFEDIPGVWRHGDWVRITQSGGVIIYGRSDATLNRHGIRIGTAEIYRVLNDIDEIIDSLIVNLELSGGRHFMPLFVKLKSDLEVTQALKSKIAQALRTQCSPRHVPDDVIAVPDIPYTISGKKMEAPVKKILMGMAVDRSLNVDAMRNPESLHFFQHYQLPEVQ
jgi:acetoacetyl-CoA synthetase